MFFFGLEKYDIWLLIQPFVVLDWILVKISSKDLTNYKIFFLKSFRWKIKWEWSSNKQFFFFQRWLFLATTNF